jgi:hypothetical protein
MLIGRSLETYIRDHRDYKLIVELGGRGEGTADLNVYIQTIGDHSAIYSSAEKFGLIDVNGSMYSIKGDNLLRVGPNEKKLLRTVTCPVKPADEVLEVSVWLRVEITLHGSYVDMVELHGTIIL